MGGWMDYQRVRTRNGLMHRDVGAYGPIPEHAPTSRTMLNGDLNRMEQDYLDPQYPEPPWATREAASSPAEECAAATGVDVDVVRRVLSFVFGVSASPTTSKDETHG